MLRLCGPLLLIMQEPFEGLAKPIGLPTAAVQDLKV